MRCLAAGFARDRAGVAAIEFALLAPAFIVLLVGSISLSLLVFAGTSLDAATAAAARCAAVETMLCRDAATTVAVAAARYAGTGTPAFTCTGSICGGTAACGSRVTGRVDIVLDLGIARTVVPLRAEACHP